MIPYSFTRNGGAEYLIPLYRNTLIDKPTFLNQPLNLPGGRSSINPLGYETLALHRPFAVRFAIFADAQLGQKLDTLVDAAVLAFSKNGTFKIKMDDDTYRQQEVVLSNVEKDFTRKKFGICDILVEGSGFPWWFSTVENSQVITSPTTNATITSDYTVIEPITIELVNSGASAVTGFSLKNNTTGSELSIYLPGTNTTTISVGDNSVIRSTAPTINNRKDVLIVGSTQIELFKLQPGVNQIQRTVNANVAVTLKWRNVWL